MSLVVYPVTFGNVRPVGHRQSRNATCSTFYAVSTTFFRHSLGKKTLYWCGGVAKGSPEDPGTPNPITVYNP